MSRFSYNEANLNIWYSNVIAYLTDGGNVSSVGGIQTQLNTFSEKIKEVAESGKFTGPAARTHYTAMAEVHNATAKFLNSFSEEFRNVIQSLKSYVSNVEATSGFDASYSTSNTTDINRLNETFDAGTTNEATVNYDGEMFDSAIATFDTVTQNIESLIENVKTEISKIGSENSVNDVIWDGDQAVANKEAMLSIIDSEFPKVRESIETSRANLNTFKNNAFGSSAQ